MGSPLVEADVTAVGAPQGHSGHPAVAGAVVERQPAHPAEVTASARDEQLVRGPERERRDGSGHQQRVGAIREPVADRVGRRGERVGGVAVGDERVRLARTEVAAQEVMRLLPRGRVGDAPDPPRARVDHVGVAVEAALVARRAARGGEHELLRVARPVLGLVVVGVVGEEARSREPHVLAGAVDDVGHRHAPTVQRLGLGLIRRVGHERVAHTPPVRADSGHPILDDLGPGRQFDLDPSRPPARGGNEPHLSVGDPVRVLVGLGRAARGRAPGEENPALAPLQYLCDPRARPNFHGANDAVGSDVVDLQLPTFDEHELTRIRREVRAPEGQLSNRVGSVRVVARHRLWHRARRRRRAHRRDRHERGGQRPAGGEPSLVVHPHPPARWPAGRAEPY